MTEDMPNYIKLQENILRLTGLWPQQRSRLCNRISTMMGILISSTFTITLIAELVKQHKNYVVFIEHLSLVATPISFSVKLVMFIRKSSQFDEINQYLRKETFNRHPKDINEAVGKYLRITRNVGVLYAVICSIICLLFCTRPLYTELDMPLRFSFELGPYRVPMMIFQVLGMTYAVLVNSSLDGLAMLLMGIAAAQINVLNYTLKNFKNDCDESKKDYISYLNQCVQNHNDIIRFIEAIEDVFSLIFLAQYLTSGVLICNIGFQLVLIRGQNLQFVNTCMYFIAMMGQLAMYCWYGNEIIVNSTDTKRACYESDWLDCDVKVRKMLIIITEKSKRPLFLTAGKFSILSLNSFTTVVNSSYSYFALLQKLYKKSNQF